MRMTECAAGLLICFPKTRPHKAGCLEALHQRDVKQKATSKKRTAMTAELHM